MIKAQTVASSLLFILLLTACSFDQTHEYQGYVEGRYTYVATSVSGVLKKLLVSRGSLVKAGEALFELDREPEADQYEAALQKLNEQRANREAALASLTYSEKTYKRYQTLVIKNAIQASQLDESKSKYENEAAQLKSMDATLAAAEADVKQAKWLLDQKTISAPINSRVFDTYYRIGELTVASQPILSLLAPADIKAIFYVPETNLSQLQLNDEIAVHCDGCTEKYAAHISYISPVAEYTPPVIFSTETNVKLIFRVEADFTPENAVFFHPGQPIQVTVTTHAK